MAFILQVEAPLQGNFRSTSVLGCPGCSSGMLTCCLPTANLLQDSKWGAAQCSKQHETFQCPGVLCHILKLVNGRLKVLPQTDFLHERLAEDDPAKEASKRHDAFYFGHMLPQMSYGFFLKWWNLYKRELFNSCVGHLAWAEAWRSHLA